MRTFKAPEPRLAWVFSFLWRSKGAYDPIRILGVRGGDYPVAATSFFKPLLSLVLPYRLKALFYMGRLVARSAYGLWAYGGCSL